MSDDKKETEIFSDQRIGTVLGVAIVCLCVIYYVWFKDVGVKDLMNIGPLTGALLYFTALVFVMSVLFILDCIDNAKLPPGVTKARRSLWALAIGVVLYLLVIVVKYHKQPQFYENAAAFGVTALEFLGSLAHAVGF